jgi:hypothetical protein
MVTGDAINGLPAERDTHLGDVALKASTFRKIVKFGKFRTEMLICPLLDLTKNG